MAAYGYDLGVLGAGVLSLASGATFGVRYESDRRKEAEGRMLNGL
jgi:hypothetical protein